MGPRKGKLGARKELLWPKSPVLIQSTAEEVHVKFRKWLLWGKSLFLWRSEPSKSKFRAEKKAITEKQAFLDGEWGRGGKINSRKFSNESLSIKNGVKGKEKYKQKRALMET